MNARELDGANGGMVVNGIGNKAMSCSKLQMHSVFFLHVQNVQKHTRSDSHTFHFHNWVVG